MTYLPVPLVPSILLLKSKVFPPWFPLLEVLMLFRLWLGSIMSDFLGVGSSFIIYCWSLWGDVILLSLLTSYSATSYRLTCIKWLTRLDTTWSSTDLAELFFSIPPPVYLRGLFVPVVVVAFGTTSMLLSLEGTLNCSAGKNSKIFEGPQLIRFF